MSYFRYIDPTYYYDNEAVAFTTSSTTYVTADSNVTIVIPAGKYMFDYTIRAHVDSINRLGYMRVLIDGVEIDQWQKESKDIDDRIPFCGTNKSVDLTAGQHTVVLEVKADAPADISVDEFRFTLKKWG